MKMNVLVVGGAGYIGGCVTDALLERKIPFTVYDNLTYENQYLKPVRFIYGDIRDHATLERLLPDFSHVVWLAAIVGDGACNIRPDLTREVNAESVGWLATHYRKRIIFTSTCSVYGVNENPSETSPVNPLSLYAQSKLAAEAYLARSNALIFRLGTAFGIGDSYSRIRMDLAVNYMTMNALMKGSLTIFGGKQYRPFVHVRDAGRFIAENLNSAHTGIYNLATSNSTITALAKEIQKVTGCKINFSRQKFQDDRSYNADIRKGLRDKVFTTATKHTLLYGVKEIRELVLSNRIKDLDLEYYSNERYLLKTIETYQNGFRKTYEGTHR